MKKLNHERGGILLSNLIYIIGVPILIAFIIFFLFGIIKGRGKDIAPSVSPPTASYSTTPISIEDIINSSIDETLEKSDIPIITTEDDSGISPISKNNSTNYKEYTVSEILNGKTENKDKENQSILSQELSIQYFAANYQGITKDGAIVLDMDGETKYIYLIGVESLDAEEMYYLLEGIEDLYVEYDINKKKGEGEQAYIWLKPPDNSHKENMLNVIALQNGWGSYIDPSPNIKYTYYFLKIKA